MYHQSDVEYLDTKEQTHLLACTLIERACHTEKEETSHLYAYFTGLTQIRMKISFPEKFEWSPHQLLSTIKEIKYTQKKECLAHKPTTLTYIQAYYEENRPKTEKTFSFLNSGPIVWGPRFEA
jgi:hypothetical protein